MVIDDNRGVPRQSSPTVFQHSAEGVWMSSGCCNPIVRGHHSSCLPAKISCCCCCCCATLARRAADAAVEFAAAFAGAVAAVAVALCC